MKKPNFYVIFEDIMLTRVYGHQNLEIKIYVEKLTLKTNVKSLL